MPDRIQLDELLERIERHLSRDVICVSEAAHRLLFEIEYDIAAHGSDGQIEWLLNRVSELPAAIREEIDSYVHKPDETVFVRNVDASAPYPVPDNWKPVPRSVRSNVDYGTTPPTITVHRDDESTCDLDANDPWPQLVFALRQYFESNSNNAG